MEAREGRQRTGRKEGNRTVYSRGNMVKLYVSIKQMEERSLKFGNYGSALSQAADQILYIENQLNDTLRERAGLGGRLGKTETAIRACKDNMEKMQRSLLYAIEEYNKCENSILGNVVAENGAPASVSQQGRHDALVEFANTFGSSFLFNKFDLGSQVQKNLNFGDKAGYSLSKGLDVVMELLLQKDPTTEVVKRNLAVILQDMEMREHDYAVPDEINLVIDCIKTGGEMNATLAQKYGDVLDGLGIAGDILEYGDDGANYLKYLLTDYSKSLETLETLKNYGVDGNTEAAVNELIAQYKSKFIGGLGEAWNIGREIILEKGAEAAFDAATGGLYSVVDLGKDIILEVGGINDKTAAVETLLGTTIIESNVFHAYTEAVHVIGSGDFTESDVANLKTMFDMYKTIKQSQYECALQIIGEDCSVAERQVIEQEITMIKEMTMTAESVEGVLAYNHETALSEAEARLGGSGRDFNVLSWLKKGALGL